MIIDTLTLRNFRLFEDLRINFDERVSVLIGVNGAGKSAVLDAMSILLSCFVGGFDGIGGRQICLPNCWGSQIPELTIRRLT